MALDVSQNRPCDKQCTGGIKIKASGGANVSCDDQSRGMGYTHALNRGGICDDFERIKHLRPAIRSRQHSHHHTDVDGGYACPMTDRKKKAGRVNVSCNDRSRG